jgi:hypothetical protein
MLSDFRIGALVLGAILLLAAVLSGSFRLFHDRFPRATGGLSRALVGLVGYGLMVWVWATRPPVDAIQSARSAVLACHEPASPAVPDGATVALEQMTTARKAFQAYDVAVNGYLKCLDSTLDPMTNEAAGSTPAADREKVKTFQTDIHNAAVEHEQVAVEKFNVQLRLYKAKHSGP